MSELTYTQRLHDVQHHLIKELQFVKSLRGLNVLAGLIHLSLIFLLYILNIRVHLPITTYHTSMIDGKFSAEVQHIATVDVFFLVIIYLAIAAVFHLLIATVLFKRYSAFLKQQRNPFRRAEYSLSASLMLVALCLSSGITSAGVLLAVFVTTACMNISGWVFENVRRKTFTASWSPFVLGCILGTLPWVLIVLALRAFSGSTVTTLTNTVPIYVLIFIVFLLFPLNMWLWAKKIGPWKSYINVELGYIGLSYLAKTALAVLLYFNLTNI